MLMLHRSVAWSVACSMPGRRDELCGVELGWTRSHMGGVAPRQLHLLSFSLAVTCASKLLPAGLYTMGAVCGSDIQPFARSLRSRQVTTWTLLHRTMLDTQVMRPFL